MLNETGGLARGRLEFSKMMPEINPGVIQSKKTNSCRSKFKAVNKEVEHDVKSVIMMFL